MARKTNAVSLHPLSMSNTEAPTPLQRIVEALRSEETFNRVVEAIKASGTKKRENTVETMAKSFVGDAVKQVSDITLEGHKNLAECTPASVVGAVEKLASWGIPPNHITQEGWLTARYQKNLNAMVCVAIPGVRGLERLLVQHGADSIKSLAIRRQDHFECIEGTEERVVFKRNLLADPQKPNDIIGACAMIKMRDGRTQITTVPVNERDLSAKAGRMTLEAAACYRAQRPAMRTAMRSLIGEVDAIRKLMEYDHENRIFAGEDEAPQQPKPQLTIPQALGISAPAEVAPEAPQTDLSLETTKKAVATVEIAEGRKMGLLSQAAIDRLSALLEVQTGPDSKNPFTPMKRINEQAFKNLAEWAKKGKSPQTEGDKAFVAAIVEAEAILSVEGVSFSDARKEIQRIITESHLQAEGDVSRHQTGGAVRA
jgi:recombinational DNA repair protein RecT